MCVWCAQYSIMGCGTSAQTTAANYRVDGAPTPAPAPATGPAVHTKPAPIQAAPAKRAEPIDRGPEGPPATGVGSAPDPRIAECARLTVENEQLRGTIKTLQSTVDQLQTKITDLQMRQSITLRIGDKGMADSPYLPCCIHIRCCCDLV